MVVVEVLLLRGQKATIWWQSIKITIFSRQTICSWIAANCLAYFRSDVYLQFYLETATQKIFTPTIVRHFAPRHSKIPPCRRQNVAFTHQRWLHLNRHADLNASAIQLLRINQMAWPTATYPPSKCGTWMADGKIRSYLEFCRDSKHFSRGSSQLQQLLLLKSHTIVKKLDNLLISLVQ